MFKNHFLEKYREHFNQTLCAKRVQIHGSRMVPGKKNILSAWQPPLNFSGGRHLIYHLAATYSIWRPPHNFSGDRHLIIASLLKPNLVDTLILWKLTQLQLFISHGFFLQRHFVCCIKGVIDLDLVIMQYRI